MGRRQPGQGSEHAEPPTGVPTSGSHVCGFRSLCPSCWQSPLIEQEGPDGISMNKLPAGSKGQRGRAPRPASAPANPWGDWDRWQEQQGEPGARCGAGLYHGASPAPHPTASPAPLCPQAMAATVMDSGGVRIITEVIPATDPRAAQLASSSVPPAPAVSSFQVKGFRKAQPKLLGVRPRRPGGKAPRCRAGGSGIGVGQGCRRCPSLPPHRQCLGTPLPCPFPDHPHRHWHHSHLLRDHPDCGRAQGLFPPCGQRDPLLARGSGKQGTPGFSPSPPGRSQGICC